MEHVFADVKGAGVLDYVTAWYMKAVNYVRGDERTTTLLDNLPEHAEASTREDKDSVCLDQLHHARRTGRRAVD